MTPSTARRVAFVRRAPIFHRFGSLDATSSELTQFPAVPKATTVLSHAHTRTGLYSHFGDPEPNQLDQFPAC